MASDTGRAMLHPCTESPAGCDRYDDSVEMEAQGLPEAIDKVIAVLRNDRYIFIEDMDVREIPLENDSGFHVRSSW